MQNFDSNYGFPRRKKFCIHVYVVKKNIYVFKDKSNAIPRPKRFTGSPLFLFLKEKSVEYVNAQG